MTGNSRRGPRFNLDSRLFIELVSPQPDGGDPGTIIRCKTLNISVEGAQVQLDHALTAGSILQVGVEMLPEEEPLYLAAEVVWCRRAAAPGDAWTAGLRILNANGSDVQNWREIISTF